MFYALRGLEAALDTDRPDVVHVVSEPWSLLALQAARWVRKHPEVALVVQGSDTNWSLSGRLERRTRVTLAGRVLDRADAYTAESLLATEQSLRAGFDCKKLRLAVNPNPRDPTIFRPSLDEAERRSARRSLGLPELGLGIGFAGRMVPEKGPKLLLDALTESCVADGSRVWAAFAGDGPLASDMRTDAIRFGHHFCGSLAYPEEMATYFRALDVFVAPSWSTSTWEEQGPRALVEAKLSGCVLVAARSGAMPEVVGPIGIIFDQGDRESLASALSAAIDLCESPGARAASRDDALERFSSSAAARQLHEVWTRALEERARTSPKSDARTTGA